MSIFDSLDKALWKPAGKGLSEADTFMKREMPFDMSWGFPAALVAAYFGGPAVMEAMGEAGGAGAGGESVLGAGGMNGYLESLGVGQGGEFIPTAGNSFSLDFLNPSTGLPWEDTGSGLTGNGSLFPTEEQQAGLDDLIAKQSAKYPMPSSSGSANDFAKQQMMAKALSSFGGSASKPQISMPQMNIPRQAGFAPAQPTQPIQNEDVTNDNPYIKFDSKADPLKLAMALRNQ